MAKRISYVNTDRCVSCGECQHVCPKGAVTIYKGSYAVVDAGLCVGCGLCEKGCPAYAISMRDREDASNG